MIQQKHCLVSESKFVKTKPIGAINQPDFYNGAFLVDTEMDKNDFKEWLKDVEKQLGRVRTKNKYAPRNIDLDIVIWNGNVVDQDVYERDFLHKAVMEVYPDLDQTDR